MNLLPQPLHFACYEAHSSDKPILVTEGALKAESARRFMIGTDVLASAGANCSHEEIVAATHFRPVWIAFDTDYYENLQVARALARLLNSFFANSAKLSFQPKIRILT